MDSSTVMSCREFWLKYFWLTDEKIFQPSRKKQAQGLQRLFRALDELLLDREIQLSVTTGFDLTLSFRSTASVLLLRQGIRGKQYLLGAIEPHECSCVFTFDEIIRITRSVIDDQIPRMFTFLLLMGFWGRSHQEKKQATEIVRIVKVTIAETSLFDKQEVSAIAAQFDITNTSDFEHEWIDHPKWGRVGEGPMTLRSLQSERSDYPKFNFPVFNRFIDSLKIDQ